MSYSLSSLQGMGYIWNYITLSFRAPLQNIGETNVFAMMPSQNIGSANVFQPEAQRPLGQNQETP